jgi:hypothetical protein
MYRKIWHTTLVTLIVLLLGTITVAIAAYEMPSDFWEDYQKVFPSNTHQCVGKESGETAHVERWNNTLRQRLGSVCAENTVVLQVRRLPRSGAGVVSPLLQHKVVPHQLICNHYPL